MSRNTREQRDAEARNSGTRRSEPHHQRRSTPRGRKLGEVLETRSTDELMTKAAANPAMFGHLLPPSAHVAGQSSPSDD